MDLPRRLQSAAIIFFLIVILIESSHTRHHGRIRHKRQHGAHLYLPESYVIPGGEGNPHEWGSWGSPSECSRTCGGGVAYQTRECLNIGSDDMPRCTGGNKKYFSCNSQDCPDTELNYRHQQCSHFDNVPFEGVRYEWIPFTKAPNPCELNCMPRGERFYYRHKAKVIDGTRCNEESLDVCVDGMCQPVGCDMMLGSSAREDKCRKCTGDGSSCKTISGLLDMNDLQVGYNDILLIPSGATNIKIQEVSPSNNYLAIRNLSGNYYLNGNWRIDFPRPMTFADSIWHYDRRPQGLSAPDHLSCMGPTSEPVYVVLLYQDRNVGIDYEYSVPEGSAYLSAPDTYAWTHTEFNVCSVTCGGGFQTRNVTCNSRTTLETVDESLCDPGSKPADTQQCGQEKCPPKWTEGEWGKCSTQCGTNGTQTRTVHCSRIISTGVAQTVDDQVCLEQVGNKPADTSSCNVGLICPEWHTGPWQPCDKLCGDGTQKRKVICFKKEKGKIQVLSDSDCTEKKPDDKKMCMLRPCEGVDWIASSWSGCKTCGLTQETRSAHCASKSGKIFNDTFCKNHKMPELTRPCNASDCKYQWFSSQWSKCSAECGKGVQTRRVLCGTYDEEFVRRANDESQCDANEKPDEEKECETKKECAGQWFSGPWSDCDKKCGGGRKTRKILCIANDVPVSPSQCNEDAIEFASEDCNKDACLEDETIPVDSTSKPIEEDDESEEWCDEEDEDDDDDGDDDETQSSVMKVVPTDGTNVSDGFEIDGSAPTKETSLITDDLMLSDATGFEAQDSETGTDLPEIEEGSSSDDDYSSMTDGSGDDDLSTTETTISSDFTDSSTSYSTDSYSTDSTSTDGSSTDSSSTESSSTDSSSNKSDTTDSDTTDSDTTDSDTTESDTTDSDTTDSDTTESDTTGSDTTDETDTSTLSSITVPSSDGSTETTESIGTDQTTESSESTIDSSTYSTQSTFEQSTETTITQSTDTSTTDISSTSDSTTEISSTSEISSSSDSTESTESTVSTESTSTESTESTEQTETTGSSISTESTPYSSTTESSTEFTSSDITDSTEYSTTDSSAITSSTDISTEAATESSTIESSSIQQTTDISDSTEITSIYITSTTQEIPTDSTIESSTGTLSETTSSDITFSTDTIDSTTSSISTTDDTVSTDETQTTDTSTSVDMSTMGSTTEGSEGTTVDIWSTTDGSGASDDDLDSWSSTPNTLFAVIRKEQTPRKCKPRPKIAPCLSSKFGCCSDNTTTATGPFDEGCPVPETCKDSKHGCCSDGVSPAQGKNNKGCPESVCAESLFGCCPDGVTESQGNENEGCPIEVTTTTTEQQTCATSKDGCDETTIASESTEEESTSDTSDKTSVSVDEFSTPEPTSKPDDCNTSKYGCCPDGVIEATGENYQGCAVLRQAVQNCQSSAYGCCQDNYTPATGPNNEGCSPCLTEPFRCCPNGITPAHGPNGEGCCLDSTYGCCTDNITPARGANLEGCDCNETPYGCCPDGKTAATGGYYEGCGCEVSRFGCCPDKITPSPGEKYEGCPCHTFQFGCCPDGITVPKGPHNYGCHCSQTEFKCCSDEITPAQGPNFEGCTCATSKYGCCPDGVTDAQGTKFEGCENVPTNQQKACSLKKDGGNCTNFTVKNFFDIEYGGCSRFWYSGCGGNDNRFETIEDCKNICEQPEGKAACILPKIPGPCTGYYPSYYYDADRNSCSQFVYGGCLGNNNRFETVEACQALCVVDSNISPCEQPVEQGPCAGNYQRWYYDMESDGCRPFAYGGCKGNKNNYETEHACNYHCKTPGVHKGSCSLPKETGNCVGRFARWYFSHSDNKCMPFYFSGCEGNKNNYISEEQCAEQCPKKVIKDLCFKPAEVGECQNYTARWYYDTKEERCRQFYYGGCGGNGNNFIEEDACLKRCEQKLVTTVAPVAAAPAAPSPTPYAEPVQPVQPQQPAQPDVVEDFKIEYCYLDYDSGPCRTRQVRWYYNKNEGLCDMFAYGGCEGNQNNFNSVEDCEGKCGNVQNACGLPPVYGRCQENITRWYYDERTFECVEFVYSGCRGNRNNFYTQSECQNQCLRTNDTDVLPRFGEDENYYDDSICYNPLDEGNCYDNILSYYYNSERSACEQFYYTGCGGNANRFETREHCERQCAEFKAVDICQQEVNPGPCDDQIMKYYYDQSTKECLTFIYSGCEGSANRFDSITECQSICGYYDVTSGTESPPLTRPPLSSEEKQAICLLPVLTGKCTYGQDYHRRWFYDDERGSCASFIYSGCDGNQNNFESYESCLDFCTNNEQNNVIDPDELRTQKPDECQETQRECDSIHCPYGVSRTYDRNGCQRCECENPCRDFHCTPDSRCSVDIQPDPELGTAFIPICRKVVKSGECPAISDNTRCDGECYTDADCRGDNKCCDAGCGNICVAPAVEPITHAPPVDVPKLPDVYHPEQPRAPMLEERTRQEVDVLQPEGDVATLRCFATGYPLPTITWRRGTIIIRTDQGRYVLSSTGDLQIVQVHRSDSGTYVCIADNGIGAPVQREVNLTIADPVPGRHYILGDANATAIVTLAQPATIRCLAGGYPRPHVTWWRGTEMLPLKSTHYEVNRDNSLVISNVELSDLGPYTCQAYSGYGKALSIYVTLKAYGPVQIQNADDEKYLKYIIQPLMVSSTPHTPPYDVYPPQILPGIPRIVELPQVSIIPVITRMDLPQGNAFAVGADIAIHCEVEGYPTPNVTWFKDNNEIIPSNRIQISESHRLLVMGAIAEDSGNYKCLARNEYSHSQSETYINVEGVFVPLGCDDNPFFANCLLIIKAKYCNHKYYAKFCCRSCTLAGQLNNNNYNSHSFYKK